MTTAVKEQTEKRSRYKDMSTTEKQLAVEVGARIAELRGALEISQGELGKRAGINQTTISLIETGKQLPSIGSLVKLSAVFDTNLVVSFAERPY